MMILKAYKYRLYPTAGQKEYFAKSFGCVGFIYNWGLDQKNKAYQENNKNISYYGLSQKLTKLKKEYEWLRGADSQSLKMSLINLDKAFTRFFREKKGFPKFKSKKTNRHSFQVPFNTRRVDFEKGLLTIPKCKDIPIRINRTFEGKIKTITISKTPTGKYFASILVETPGELPQKKPLDKSKSIGIDLGISSYLSLSNGVKIDNPKYLEKSIKKLKREQKRLSKKQKGSNNRTKQRYILAKQYEKATNQRDDFLHKLSRQLVDENQVNTFCIEDLNIAGMLKNHHLARSITSASWTKFVQFLTYKSEWAGKNVLKIGRFEPSSKMCNSCGKINDIKLSDRTIKCDCGHVQDRDIGAAINILNFAYQKQNLIGRDTPNSKPAERPGLQPLGSEPLRNRNV